MTATAFGPTDIYRQVWVDELVAASNGTILAYSLRRAHGPRTYASELWTLTLEGNAERQVALCPGAGSRPRFAPNGRALLYLSGSGAHRQPWLVELSSGETRRRIVELPGGVHQAEWAPTGERILLIGASGVPRLGDERVARQVTSLTWRRDGLGIRSQFASLWSADADGGGLRRLTEPNFEVHAAAWESDSAIAFVADLSATASLDELPQLWRVDINGGEPELIAQLPGRIIDVAASRAGRLAVTGVEVQNAPLWAPFHAYVLESQGLRRLGERLERPVASVTITDLVDGTYNFAPRLRWVGETGIVVTSAARGSSHPTLLRLDGGTELLADGELITTAVTEAGDGWAFVATQDGQPPEVRQVAGGAVETLTRRGSGWLAGKGRRPEHHVIPSSRTGAGFDAWLVPPSRPGDGRLVLHIHGGPYAAHGPAPWTEMLTLAGVGIAVLYLNPPGSVGYGDGYARTLAGAWGQADLGWYLDATDWAVDHGVARRGRIGVMGLSYGGLAVLSLLTTAPERFAAAICENPVSHMPSYDGTTDLGTGIGGLGLDPYADNPAAHLAASYALGLGRGTPPVLVLTAAADLRCPPGQAEMVFSHLLRRGCLVRMVRYPDESHRLFATGRPDRRADRLTRIRDWFLTHL